MDPVTDDERTAWLAQRRGYVTASRFHTIAHGRVRGWRTYLAILTAERCGEVFPELGAAATSWGQEKEPLAIEAFEQATGFSVDHEPGFLTHPDLPGDVGCSPDGLLNDGVATGIEVKCPYKRSVHIEYRTNNVVPDKYVSQVQGTMWVLGFDHYYFASYDARNEDLFWIRVERDDRYIARLETRMGLFLSLLNDGGEIPDKLDPMGEIPEAICRQ